MPRPDRQVIASLVLVSTLTWAQEVAVLRDLDAQGRVTLTRDELNQLLPGAKMSRLTGKGNTQFWKNDAGGSFIISSDNRDKSGRVTTAQFKWHIAEDGPPVPARRSAAEVSGPRFELATNVACS